VMAADSARRGPSCQAKRVIARDSPLPLLAPPTSRCSPPCRGAKIALSSEALSTRIRGELREGGVISGGNRVLSRTESKTVTDEEERLLPIPTQFVSNGEFYPPPQTRQQRIIEDLIRTTAGERARKTGLSE